MVSLNKKYSNGEITVYWQPEKCIHAAECVKSLPKVFNVNRKPWVDVTAATTDQIIATVNKCPSKALTFTYDK